MEFLNDTNIVVAIAFAVFIGILLYVGVPKIVAKMLDDRAAKIKSDIDEARELREEAQSLLASFERKQKEVQAQADKIVANAKDEAEAAAVKAKEDLKTSIARRMQAAEDQITSAQNSAVKAVQSEAVSVAIAAAQDVIAKNLSAKDQGSLIDDAIAEVSSKLH